ncbi:MAG: cation:H+ antiporter [Patescibacteria group bacterium]|jgi:cation:H+ antiporter
MEVFTWFIILLISLAVLSKSSDWFTDAAEKVGLRLGMSSFVVGVTIVAIGTSLPELISSMFAVLSGNSEIVAGNIVGSNIANILLILGVAALIAKRIEVKEAFIRIDLMVFIMSAFIVVFVMFDAKIVFFEAILLVLCFVFYLIYILRDKEPSTKAAKKDVKGNIKKKVKTEVKEHGLHFFVYLQLIISLVLLTIASKYTIDSVVVLSNLLSIGKDVIAATVVAFGTSLPELAVSVSAARRGNAEIAVGNILGSNIFNSFMVLGVAGIFGTLVVAPNIMSIGLLYMIVATFLYFFIIKDRTISFWEGGFLVLMYLMFILQILGLL